MDRLRQFPEKCDCKYCYCNNVMFKTCTVIFSCDNCKDSEIACGKCYRSDEFLIFEFFECEKIKFSKIKEVNENTTKLFYELETKTNIPSFKNSLEFIKEIKNQYKWNSSQLDLFIESIEKIYNNSNNDNDILSIYQIAQNMFNNKKY